MKKRLLFDRILEQVHHKNAVIVTGMRQVGKTTLLKQLFDELEVKTKLWFDFDNPLDQKVFEDTDYRVIYERLGNIAGGKDRLYVFLDEIQNYPEITKVVKYLIDHYGVKFFVTGSSNFYLKNLFPESLSGRKFLYQLMPMSFREYLYFRDKIERKDALVSDIDHVLGSVPTYVFSQFRPDYEDFMQFGGLPEVVLTADYKTKSEVLKNIFVSFFEKDIRILSDYKDIKDLRDLLMLLVPRVGSMLDVTKIANELHVDRPKIYGYLEFLQGIYAIKLIPKFSKSIDRAVAGGKKVYFTDNGILKVLGSVNDGQLLENTVVNQLSGYGDVSFYTKRNTAEIDIVLNKQYAFEVKLTGSESDYKKLSVLAQEIGIKKYYVISKNIHEQSGFINPEMI